MTTVAGSVVQAVTGADVVLATLDDAPRGSWVPRRPGGPCSRGPAQGGGRAELRRDDLGRHASVVGGDQEARVQVVGQRGDGAWSWCGVVTGGYDERSGVRADQHLDAQRTRAPRMDGTDRPTPDHPPEPGGAPGDAHDDARAGR